MSERYQHSEELLVRALKTIPLGSQTFSKSRTQYPLGVSPFFIQRGQGSRVWDVDGNEYVDFINSLCAINLGHRDPDVDSAVRAQMEEGTIFTLPHPIEMQVAEKLVEMVPCAELVRFGKNGSDATSGAIRVARAWTGRDRVITCGYHGWQDWYIGATLRNKGVPKATRELTYVVPYNDLEAMHAAFRQHKGEIAAVIMEPMNVASPKDGYLGAVAELARSNGAVFIFDETITGFRFANGGAQEKFGVTPDLATFGKGMANGYPVSAVVGKAELMHEMEEIFFSFTFGGETLSLAAALTTMLKLQREPVIEHMRSQGQKVLDGASALVRKHGLEEVIGVSGDPTWSFLGFRDAHDYTQWQFKTLFMQEVFARGVLAYGSHNMSYAHGDAEVSKLLVTYDEVFSVLADAVRAQDLDRRLRCDVLQPLFRLR